MGEAPGSELPAIDLGVVVAGPLAEADQRAVQGACDQLRDELSRCFPELVWRLPLVRREEAVTSPRVEPVDLLPLGV